MTNMRHGEPAAPVPVIDAEGTTYEPWSDGWAVGFKATHPEFGTRYIYLNPSSDSDDGVSTVFMYEGGEGETDEDEPVVFVNTFEAQAHAADAVDDKAAVGQVDDEGTTAYPNGRCDTCGWGLDEAHLCRNADCAVAVEPFWEASRP